MPLPLLLLLPCMLLTVTLFCRVIIPTIVNNPVMTNPVPVILATQIPYRDQIFSPKIIAANSPIHSKFIHPKATIKRKYGQQHPRQ